MSTPWSVPDGTVVFPTMAAAILGDPATLALQRTADGDLVAVGFTRLEQLVAVFGPQQTWVAFTREAIPGLLEGSGVTRILIDADITRELSQN